jgi:hypothetical protein
MATARAEVSIPHARFEGGWKVLKETSDGRTAVAVREDECAGIAMVYPAVESADYDGIERVAALVNATGEYLLLSASFESMASVEWLLADRTVSIASVPPEGYRGLSGSDIRDLLSDGTLMIIGPGRDDPFPGALQLFEDVATARSTWVEPFPQLDNRLVAIQRLLADVDLAEFASWTRLGSGASPT